MARMARFSEATETHLRAAGWYPDRASDVADELRLLRLEGYDTPPPVIQFLREFGGITVTHPHAAVPDSEDNFVVSARTAIQGRYAREWVAEYVRRTSSPSLTPVGEAARGYLILVMDPSGKVFGGYDNALVQLGDSGDEAIENLCSGGPTIEVP